MTLPEYADEWNRYWADVHDGSGQLVVENAARDPDRSWLVGDLQILDEEFEVDPDHVHEHPDAVIAAARDGFASFVEKESLVADPDPEGYEALPVHLTGLDRVAGTRFEFGDPVDDAGRLVQATNARVTDDPTRSVRATHVSYRCPLGHETRIHQPRHRTWTVETCGTLDCSNDVVINDDRTRVRRTVELTVEVDGRSLDCVATGRNAEDTDHFRRLRDADRLLVAGIPRLLVKDDAGVEPVLELLHAEQT